MYLTACPPYAPGSIPGHSRVFQGIFPWLITLCQPVLSQCDRKCPNLPSMAPHNLWTARRKAEVQLQTYIGLKEKERCVGICAPGDESRKHSPCCGLASFIM